MTQLTQALGIGASAPSFDLLGIEGKQYTLASFQEHPLLAIIFSANHCPYVSAWEDRMIALGREYIGRGVGFALISSSDVAKHPQDTFEENRTRATEKGYPFPFLYDEYQSAARAFGATRTPEVFLFDGNRIVQYHGAIDSDFEEREGTDFYLQNAIDSLLAGKDVQVPETPPIGCKINLR
jgi:peroxiredoxin